MQIFQCQTPGCPGLSLSGKNKCPECGHNKWQKADTSKFDDNSWAYCLNLTEGHEQEFEIIKKWADTGNIDAMKLLGVMYFSGIGCERNPKESVYWISAAADKKDPESLGLLGHMYLEGAGVKSDLSKAKILLDTASEMGDGYANFLLGQLYEKDFDGKNNNVQKAMDEYLIGAMRGNKDAMYQLGVRLCFNTLGREECWQAGISWLWRAATAGDGDAQLSLGMALADAPPDEEDLHQAKYWLRRAIESGTPDAALAYGSLWMDEHIPKETTREEFEEIRQVMAEALSHDDYSAQSVLGDLFMRGYGINKQVRRAYMQYTYGMHGGNDMCRIKVAHCQRMGIGTEKDPESAAKILASIINRTSKNKQICIPACVEMAEMLENGEGVDQNMEQAVQLYRLAADIGNEDAIRHLAMLAIAESQYVEDGVEDGLQNLIMLAEDGDYQSALELARYFKKEGSDVPARRYLNIALSQEQWEDSKEATKLAKEYFPELLRRKKPYNPAPLPDIGPEFECV